VTDVSALTVETVLLHFNIIYRVHSFDEPRGNKLQAASITRCCLACRRNV